MAVLGALVVDLAGLVIVPVLSLVPSRVIVLVGVPVSMRVAVNGSVGVDVLVGVNMLVFVRVHRNLLTVCDVCGLDYHASTMGAPVPPGSRTPLSRPGAPGNGGPRPEPGPRSRET